MKLDPHSVKYQECARQVHRLQDATPTGEPCGLTRFEAQWARPYDIGRIVIIPDDWLDTVDWWVDCDRRPGIPADLEFDLVGDMPVPLNMKATVISDEEMARKWEFLEEIDITPTDDTVTLLPHIEIPDWAQDEHQADTEAREAARVPIDWIDWMRIDPYPGVH